MRKQTGFTLIEIAIVLVIIGLLLGGVLKGQELITSARVHNMASMQDGFKVAFFGFQDRFRALPGDYTAAASNIPGVATAACGTTTGGNGNGDGQILGDEMTLAWEHMSKAGFITGSYTCAAVASISTASTPANIYNGFVQLIYDGSYGVGTGTPPSTLRHNIKSGPQIPVAIIAELDRKIDDGVPGTGTFQFSTYAGTGTGPTGGSTTAPACTSSNTATGAGAAVWNANLGVTNCGGATLL
jgi:prepilin-type N-terminal cleavage/methylation domain-containing protein